MANEQIMSQTAFSNIWDRVRKCIHPDVVLLPLPSSLTVVPTGWSWWELESHNTGDTICSPPRFQGKVLKNSDITKWPHFHLDTVCMTQVHAETYWDFSTLDQLSGRSTVSSTHRFRDLCISSMKHLRLVVPGFAVIWSCVQCLF